MSGDGDSSRFCSATRASVLDLRGARLDVTPEDAATVRPGMATAGSLVLSIGTAPSTAIDKHVVNVALGLEVGRISPWPGVPTLSRGDLPRRDGVPREGEPAEPPRMASKDY